jgi:hypothetical protein
MQNTEKVLEVERAVIYLFVYFWFISDTVSSLDQRFLTFRLLRTPTESLLEATDP